MPVWLKSGGLLVFATCAVMQETSPRGSSISGDGLCTALNIFAPPIYAKHEERKLNARAVKSKKTQGDGVFFINGGRKNIQRGAQPVATYH